VTFAVLAYDEGPGAGLGHRRRCEAIADALDARGVTTLRHALDDADVEAPVVVVDSYRRRADDGSVRGNLVVALDDLDRDLAVDCVVDPSLDARAANHARARRVLAGPQYAPLPRALAGRPRRPPDGVARRVLVTTGGADAAGIGPQVAGRIGAADPALHVRLVLGPWGTRAVPRHVVAVSAPTGLDAELAAADVVVTAGGVTLLEALALARPTIVLETAPNQRANVRAASAAGAALPATATSAADVALALVGDTELRQSLARAARVLVDGRGSDRIADVIVSLAETAA
jgi:UDP-2,4-diacetamido-2,4,6-trideoxy-beta-L-altropyranose hydrolase